MDDQFKSIVGIATIVSVIPILLAVLFMKQYVLATVGITLVLISSVNIFLEVLSGSKRVRLNILVWSLMGSNGAIFMSQQIIGTSSILSFIQVILFFGLLFSSLGLVGYKLVYKL